MRRIPVFNRMFTHFSLISSPGMTTGTPGGQGQAASAAVFPAASSTGILVFRLSSASRGVIFAMGSDSNEIISSVMGFDFGKSLMARRRISISSSELKGVRIKTTAQPSLCSHSAPRCLKYSTYPCPFHPAQCQGPIRTSQVYPRKSV